MSIKRYFHLVEHVRSFDVKKVFRKPTMSTIKTLTDTN